MYHVQRIQDYQQIVIFTASYQNLRVNVPNHAKNNLSGVGKNTTGLNTNVKSDNASENKNRLLIGAKCMVVG